MSIHFAALAASVCLCATAASASAPGDTPVDDGSIMVALDGADQAGSGAVAAAPVRKRPSFLDPGGRLLLTGGVSTIEGAGGGGLVPWALIGGYGTRNEFGITSYVTGVDTQDFTLASYGATINIKNRLELSVARQNFNLREVGNALALGNR
jgi:opacity protein-like surface antigen